MVLGTAELKHRKSIFWPTTEKRWIKKNYDGIHDRFQRDSTYRASKLKIGWTERRVHRDGWHRKTTPTAHHLRSLREKKNWFSH